MRPLSDKDLVGIAIASGMKFFKDQSDELYAIFPANESLRSTETLPLRSRESIIRLLQLVQTRFGERVNISRADLNPPFAILNFTQ